jgi:putative oxidoreductase
MNWAFDKYARERDDAVLLASRLLLGWLFVHEGVDLAAHFDAAAAGMAKMGVPAPMLAGTILLQLVAGLAIALGWQARFGAAALGMFCLGTAVLFHNNFTNRNELLHFEKDLAIAGGMFVLTIQGAGGWSLDRLLRARKIALRRRAGVAHAPITQIPGKPA